ncbi:10366_t:CDS:2 [Acaulospora morrowiae]|uniref:10366_t:CDS:1 n=1 Tax=Acaulospora morrowiae TaxID=94023 RepID=A0A9N8VAL5_9GLOM|nr:10366_t:CDS:2 [Acaulospora morrowiae]
MHRVTYLGLAAHGLAFFRLFVPAGTPLALVPLLLQIVSSRIFSSK